MQNETKYTGWIGTMSSIVGSFAVALQFALLGYSLFIVGSVAWLYIGATRRDNALITLNAAFLVANLIGIYHAAI